MTYRKCPRCNQFDKDSITICTKCGYDFTKSKEDQTSDDEVAYKAGAKYCIICQKLVIPKIHYGVGTLMTGGLGAPFYKPECPICKNQKWGIKPKEESTSHFSIADELEKLSSLKEKGVISEEEFQEAKKKLI